MQSDNHISKADKLEALFSTIVCETDSEKLNTLFNIQLKSSIEFSAEPCPQIIHSLYSKSLYGVIFSIVQNEVKSQEILKETFLKAKSEIQDYNPQNERFFTWVSAIARTKSFEYGYAGAALNVQQTNFESDDIANMIYIQGMSAEQVSVKTGLPLINVIKLLRKNIQALRDNKPVF